MDYANRRRVKLWGRAKVLENDPTLVERLAEPAYSAEAKRVITFTLEAWDMNCSLHIHERYSQRQIEPVVQKLRARIQELEEELSKLNASRIAQSIRCTRHSAVKIRYNRS